MPQNNNNTNRRRGRYRERAEKSQPIWAQIAMTETVRKVALLAAPCPRQPQKLAVEGGGRVS